MLVKGLVGRARYQIVELTQVNVPVLLCIIRKVVHAHIDAHVHTQVLIFLYVIG